MSKRVCSLPSEMGHRPLLQGSTLRLHYLLADSYIYTKCIPGQAGRWDQGPLGLSHLQSENALGRAIHKSHQIFYVLSTVGLGHLAYHSRPQVASILAGKSTSQ